ncbi:MAG: hypothetical protein WC548_03915 [Candidatus Pacearchaeota archaeon]
MKNNKGQIYEFIIFIITSFMCGSVVLLYFIQQENAENSLVSPRIVLETRDDLKIFEIREKEIILESLNEVTESDKFGTKEFDEKFRGVFLKNLMDDSESKEFILKNLTWEEEARDLSREFFESIYLTEMNDDKMIFERVNIEKRFRLNADKKNRINFPVEFSFIFGKKYLISLGDDNFIMEEY